MSRKPLKCKNVMLRLDDHVDGLLPVPESEAIRDHLDACQECRETSMAIRAAGDSLSSWSDIEPRSECFAEILAKLEALPVEAYDRAKSAQPASTWAPRGFFARLPHLDDARMARFRWFATSGLAAAAAVMAAAVIVRTDAPSVLRTKSRSGNTAPAMMVKTRGFDSSPFFQGYDFDDGLVHKRLPSPSRSAGSSRSMGGGLPANMPSDLFEGSPR